MRLGGGVHNHVSVLVVPKNIQKKILFFVSFPAIIRYEEGYMRMS